MEKRKSSSSKDSSSSRDNFDADRGGGDMMDGDKKEGRGGMRKRACRFCAEKELKVDFKDQSALKYFVTERGKIIPRRVSGNCAKHQRSVARAVKQARGIALIPYLVLAQ